MVKNVVPAQPRSISFATFIGGSFNILYLTLLVGAIIGGVLWRFFGLGEGVIGVAMTATLLVGVLIIWSEIQDGRLLIGTLTWLISSAIVFVVSPWVITRRPPAWLLGQDALDSFLIAVGLFTGIFVSLSRGTTEPLSFRQRVGKDWWMLPLLVLIGLFVR